MFISILRSPILFFDTNPIGKINAHNELCNYPWANFGFINFVLALWIVQYYHLIHFKILSIFYYAGV